ncbi:MAG: hypothetical protein ACOYO1_05090 [Bacteroidales bacterium]
MGTSKTGITGTSSNSFTMGNLTDGYKTLAFQTSTTTPGIRYNHNSSKIEFSHGGVDWSTLGSGSGLANIPMGAMLLVSKTGDDNTGARGNVALPFETVTAALNAAQTGDIIYIAPGTYDGYLLIPSTIESITLRGSGTGATTLTANNPMAVIYRDSNTPFHSCEISNMTIKNIYNATGNTGLAVIMFDGYNCTGGYFDSFPGLNLNNLLIVSDGYFATVNRCINFFNINSITNVNMSTFTELTMVFAESSMGEIVNCITSMAFEYNYKNSNPQPQSGIGSINILQCNMNKLSINGVSKIECDNSTMAREIVADLSDNANNSAKIKFRGNCNSVDLKYDFSYSKYIIADFDKAIIDSSFNAYTLNSTDGYGATISARNAIFNSYNDGYITAGSGTDLDIRGSIFNQEMLQCIPAQSNLGSGTIDRSMHIEKTQGADNNPHSWAVAGFNVPFTTAPDTIIIQAHSNTTGNIGCAPNALTSTGYTLNVENVNGNVTVTAIKY